MQSYQMATASSLPESIQRLRRNAGSATTSAIESSPPPADRASFPIMGRLQSLIKNAFRCFQLTNEETTPQAPARQTPLARRRREAMIQCSLYVLAYFVSYVSATIYQLMLSRGRFSYSLCILTQLFTPGQGLFNFLVFLRPRVKSILMSQPELTRAKAVWKAVTFRDSIASLTQARRRRSLQDTQQNGGRRYTAREFHMREIRAQAAAAQENDEDGRAGGTGISNETAPGEA